MKTNLTLDEFSAATYANWRKQADATLEGAPFEKKLVSKTYEEIDLQPIYNAGDAQDLPFINSLPGFPLYVRGTRAANTPWEVAQEIPYGSPKAFNSALRNDLERGQTALNVSLDQATRLGLDPDMAGAQDVGLCGLSLATAGDVANAFDGVDLEKVPFNLQAGSAGLPMLALLVAHLRQKRISPAALHGAFEQDPIGELIADGTLPHSPEIAFDHMAFVTRWAIQNAPKLQTIGVRAFPYHDSGGSAVHELAFALATAVEYLRKMEAHGIALDDVAQRIRFSFAVGSDFFMGIAKLRAARLLWAKIVAASGGNSESQKMRIHARTALWNKTTLDPYVNMLRGTTEAFAAVVGGCDSLHVGAFDEVIRPPDEFSRRIARNTQIILRDECHFDSVIDPAGGSPFVEKLTDELAQKAWQLFQEVEKHGGMLKALEAGFPQEKVNAVFAKKADAVANRRNSIVGVNVYANATEVPLEAGDHKLAELQQKRAAQIAEHRTSSGQVKETAVLAKLGQILESNPDQVVELAIDAASQGATLGELSRTLRARNGRSPSVLPLPVRRASAPFEKLRAAATQHSPRPKVFLANMGGLGQHKARADFSTSFFQAGGFEVIENRGFPTVERAIEAVNETDARIIVICSTDATYPDIVPTLARAIKISHPAKIVIVAGYPKEHIEAFKEAGVDDFIHIRANCYDVSRRLLETLGVTL